MSKLSRLRATVGVLAPEWVGVSVPPGLDWVDARRDVAGRGARPEPFEVEPVPGLRTPATNHLHARSDTGPVRVK